MLDTPPGLLELTLAVRARRAGGGAARVTRALRPPNGRRGRDRGLPHRHRELRVRQGRPRGGPALARQPPPLWGSPATSGRTSPPSAGTTGNTAPRSRPR